MRAIEINFIEISPTFRKIQANTLGIKVDWDAADVTTKVNEENVIGEKSKLKIPTLKKYENINIESEV
jgi:hypothetical protein